MRRSVPVALATVGLLVLPAAAFAAPPQLIATVDPGHVINVTGTGFPASVDVTLAITRNDADAGTQVLHTDARGSFTTTIPAGPGLGGHYVLVATSGSVSATADVVAVETAGGGTRASAPATTTVAGVTGDAGGSVAPWLTAVLLLVPLAVSAGLVARRLRGA